MIVISFYFDTRFYFYEFAYEIALVSKTGMFGAVITFT